MSPGNLLTLMLLPLLTRLLPRKARMLTTTTMRRRRSNPAAHGARGPDGRCMRVAGARRRLTAASSVRRRRGLRTVSCAVNRAVPEKRSPSYVLARLTCSQVPTWISLLSPAPQSPLFGLFPAHSPCPSPRPFGERLAAAPCVASSCFPLFSLEHAPCNPLRKTCSGRRFRPSCQLRPLFRLIRERNVLLPWSV